MCWSASLLLLVALPAFAGVRGDAPLRAAVASSLLPEFAARQHTALLARVGDSAALRCKVLRLADRAVSWVRSSDLQILTHAGIVFTADSRVSCSEERPRAGAVGAMGTTWVVGADASSEQGPEDAWEPHTTVHTLRIAALRLSDSGRYECQVNTEPKLSLFFNLTVIDSSLPVVAVSALEGARVRGALGGAARLSCEARYVLPPGAQPSPGAQLPPGALAALPPLALRWEHQGETLDPQSPRGGISLETERWEGRLVSRLTLGALGARDAGRYTCAAPGASAHLTLRLYRNQRDDQEYDITDGEMEMQRDQAVARVSAAPASSPRFTALAVLTMLCCLRVLVT